MRLKSFSSALLPPAGYRFRAEEHHCRSRSGRGGGHPLGGLSYFHEGRGGVVSASICQVAIFEDHIGLSFIHGAYLSDPHHLLEGTQKAKRYAWIWTYDGAPWDELKQLIEEIPD